MEYSSDHLTDSFANANVTYFYLLETQNVMYLYQLIQINSVQSS